MELESRTAWAHECDFELAYYVDLPHAAERTIDERTAALARSTDELSRCSDTLAGYEASRWVKIGKVIRVGPLSR